MSSPVRLIVDASAATFTGGWHPVPQGYYFGGAASGNMALIGGSTNNNQTGGFNITFQGMDIAFVGETNDTSTFQLSIDSDHSFDVVVIDFGAQSNYTQWYQTPELEDGLHQVGVSGLQGGLDYYIVTAGASTPFNNKTMIMVDDDDTNEIHYNGSWRRNTDIIEIGNGHPSGPPLGNSTHRSNTIGDSFIFQFAGTSITVYTVFLGTATGFIDVEFKVDGQASPTNIAVNTGSPPPYDQAPNAILFHQADLFPGNHTLSANITSSSGTQEFILDYIVYTPSFNSLASKPSFDGQSSSPSPSTPFNNPQTSQSPDHTSSTPVGAIAGAVVGVVVLIVVTSLIVLFVLRKRRNRRQMKEPQEPVSPTVTPFPLLGPATIASSYSYSTSSWSHGSDTLQSTFREEKAPVVSLRPHHDSQEQEMDAGRQLEIDVLRRRIEELSADSRLRHEDVERGTVRSDLPPAYS